MAMLLDSYLVELGQPPGFNGLGFRGLGFRGLGFRGLGFSFVSKPFLQESVFSRTGLLANKPLNHITHPHPRRRPQQP